MDEQVLRAMARWPDVPAVYGWLRLGARGQWMLIDRNRPDFDESVHGAGSPITNPQIIEFIERNYDRDTLGRWYWQNGPQRVYVDLDAAPRIARVIGEHDRQRLLDTHGAALGDIREAGTDPQGRLLLATEAGAAAVHDLDLAALRFDEDRAVPERTILVIGAQRLALRRFEDPGAELGFVSRPRP